MSNYYGYDYSAPNDYLAHYGVPGMRWGHRKAPDRGSGGNGQGAPRKRHLGLKIAGGVAAGAAAAGLGYLGYKHRKGIGEAARAYGKLAKDAMHLRKNTKKSTLSNREIARGAAKAAGGITKKYANIAGDRFTGSKAYKRAQTHIRDAQGLAKVARDATKHYGKSAYKKVRKSSKNARTNFHNRASLAGGSLLNAYDKARKYAKSSGVRRRVSKTVNDAFRR